MHVHTKHTVLSRPSRADFMRHEGHVPHTVINGWARWAAWVSKNSKQETDQTVLTITKMLTKTINYCTCGGAPCTTKKNYRVPPHFKFVPAPLSGPMPIRFNFYLISWRYSFYIVYRRAVHNVNVKVSIIIAPHRRTAYYICLLLLCLWNSARVTGAPRWHDPL